MDVRDFTQAFSIPISWLPRKLSKKEFMATVERVEVVIHIDSLRARLRLISWLPRKPSKNEFIATVERVKVAIHIDSLRVGLRLPLYPFGMQFLMKEILTPAQLQPNG